jgi:hypothetical protein
MRPRRVAFKVLTIRAKPFASPPGVEILRKDLFDLAQYVQRSFFDN